MALCGIAGDVKRLFDIGAFEDLFFICASRENSIATEREQTNAVSTF